MQRLHAYHHVFWWRAGVRPKEWDVDVSNVEFLYWREERWYTENSRECRIMESME